MNMMNLNSIIKQRLNLNTNQRILSQEFNLDNATLDKIKSKIYLQNNYLNWNQEKRNRFLVIIGGRVNFKDTENFIKYLIK